MSSFAALFALLYVGHLLGDYIVQIDAMATLKVAGAPAPLLRSWLANQRHVASYSLTIAATVLTAGALGGFLADLAAVPWWRWLVAAAANWAAHSIIDRRWLVRRLMEATGSRTFHGNGGALHVDQTLHLLTLVLLAAFLGR
jgi:Protein of unknown function (DUF3307)